MMGGAAAEDTSVLGVRRRASDHFTTSAPSAGRGLLQVINDSLVGVVHCRQTTLADHLMSHTPADHLRFHFMVKHKLQCQWLLLSSLAQLLFWTVTLVSLHQMRERQKVFVLISMFLIQLLNSFKLCPFMLGQD